jgi:hypothetical protein
MRRLGELLLEDVLEGHSIGGELADTFTELLDGHLVLVEVEAEVGLVVDVGLLLEVKGRGGASIQLLGDSLAGVEEVLEQVGLQSCVSFAHDYDSSSLGRRSLQKWSGSRSQRAR